MGGWWSDKTKLMIISTQVEVVVEVGLEKGLKINFHVRVQVGRWGWLDQVGIRLSQLSTKWKLKMKLRLAKNNNKVRNKVKEK